MKTGPTRTDGISALRAEVGRRVQASGQVRRVLPYKNPDDFERIADGLRKAGLPE